MAGGLLAIDAPLGWPANHLFQRETDRTVCLCVRRRPLEVGADRIARTALAALVLLEQLRRRLGTLVAHGITASGYKKPDQTEVRRGMLDRLARLLTLPGNQERLVGQADVLDAAVCVQDGCDFLRGHAIAPTNLALAKKEGWIWVCPANSSTLL